VAIEKPNFGSERALAAGAVVLVTLQWSLDLAREHLVRERL
jgi:hypothetical protein